MRQILVPYPFILYWVTKKMITKKSDYHYVVCYAFQSQVDMKKSKKYASFATVILIL